MLMTVDQLRRHVEDEVRKAQNLLRMLGERPETDVVSVVELPQINYDYEETT